MLVVAGALARIGVYVAAFFLATASVSYPASVAVLVVLLAVPEFTVLRWVDQRMGITEVRHRLWTRKRA